MSEMFKSIPRPFEDGRFPPDLGAVVMRTVLDGSHPALQVVHLPDNSWAIAHGVNDPNEAGASLATHLKHVLDRDSSLAELASLPPGYQADRQRQLDPWVIRPFTWAD